MRTLRVAAVMTLASAESQSMVPRPGALRTSFLAGVLVLACAATVVCEDLLAQVQTGADLSYRTRYIWRGLTYVDGPVLQPGVFASLPRSSSVLTAGVWTNVDVSRRDRSSFGVRWFGETNVWIDYTARLDPVDVSAGWSGYLFNLDGARGLLGGRRNTHEVYTAARLVHGRLVPALTCWYDLGRVKGLYVVGELAVRVPVWNGVVIPIGSLWITGKLGLNAGQETDTWNPEQVGYFSDRGVTHYELGISSLVGYVPLGVVNAAVHIESGWIWKEDARTRLGPLGREHDDREFFFGLTFTVLGPRCRPEEGVCP